MKESATISSTAFYDHIATIYNEQMNLDLDNNRIRNETAAYFSKILSEGSVLDFGGGTGLDLPWLLKKKYHVVFCEPSSKMRLEAIKLVNSHYTSSSITFLDDERVAKLSASDSNIKVNAVLANFAVLNCIGDLEKIFNTLESVMRPGGHLIANVIDTRWFSLITKFPISYLKSVFTGKIITSSGGDNFVHKTYLHRLSEIKKASSPFFNFEHWQPMNGYGFLMIHLKKK